MLLAAVTGRGMDLCPAKGDLPHGACWAPGQQEPPILPRDPAPSLEP